MRAADLVRRIWGEAPPANPANLANAANAANASGAANLANSANPRPRQPRPAVLRLPQRPGDPAEEALLLLDWLHSLGVVLTLEGGALAAHGLDTLPEPLREEVQILLLPEVQGRDLLAAVRARDAATAAIERAMPLQRCWGCRHFSPSRPPAPDC